LTRVQGIVQPLRSWRVTNFKSIADAEIDLAPLTVFVGANSSGKSSFLQSILLVVQDTRGQPSDEHVALNGAYVELGGFDDVRHDGAAARDRIAIGGTFAIPTRDRRLRQGHDLSSDAQGVDPTVLEWDVELLNTGRDNLPGRARLRSVRFSVADVPDPRSLFGTGGLEYTANVVSRRRLDLGPTSGRGGLQPIAGLAGRVTAGGPADRRRGFRTVGVSHRAGVPVGVFVQGDLHAVLAKEWVQRVRQVLRDRRRDQAARENRAEPRPITERSQRPTKRDATVMNGLATAACDRLIDLVVRVVQEESDKESSSAPSAAELMAFLDSSRCEAIEAGFWNHLHSLVADAGFSRAIQQRMGPGEPVLLAGAELDRSRDLAIALERGGNAVARFLSDEVVYLGPLRQDPQVRYHAVPTSQPGFVGSKGEFALAVLHREPDREVVCPLATGGTARMPLRSAVNHWLEAFGLAAGITTIDHPRLGLEPQISVSGVERPLDMTAVGVGVSQLVPVLVMGLHAMPGMVMLIEQPELHLHPAMQQTLADFLLACVRSGRQVIVETHSDHLVTRLRRRIAEDEYDEVLNLVGLVSTERRDGATGFRRLETNRFGGFDDWPEGFFDEGSLDAQQLLRAGMRKKRGGSS
jgi:predicted ATPase